MGQSSLGGQHLPESWLEAEEHPVGAQHNLPHHQSSSAGANLYPQNWFEVQPDRIQNASQRSEDSMQYSAGGDLTGKLPARSHMRGPTQRDIPDAKVPGMNPADEGKVGDEGLRAVMASGPLSGGIRRSRSAGDAPPSNRVVESSFQNLELQLDDEAVDFLTGLRFNGHQSGQD